MSRQYWACNCLLKLDIFLGQNDCTNLEHKVSLYFVFSHISTESKLQYIHIHKYIFIWYVQPASVGDIWFSSFRVYELFTVAL